MTINPTTGAAAAPAGPLNGVRVLELGGIGPGPFAAMLLADLGADVVRIDRVGAPTLFPGTPGQNVLHRGKRSVDLNLKDPEGMSRALMLVEVADAVIEGFRPGVVERLGIGPDDCRKLNPALVYGRMTGWGQHGPLARTAGHDINYIALTGVLHAIGAVDGPPQIPINVVGDYGGGGAYLVIGILAALVEARATGEGQVVDAAIVDGAAHLLAGTHARVAAGSWTDARGVNLLDGGAPFYSVYETADGHHMAVGAIEPQFYRALIDGLALTVDPREQHQRSTWPQLRLDIAAAFRARPQQHWIDVFSNADACVSPVRGIRDALNDPHLAARGSVTVAHGHLQPGRAPRFSGHAHLPPAPAPEAGEHTDEVINDWLSTGDV